MKPKSPLVLLLSLASFGPLLSSQANADTILLTPTDDRRGLFNFGLDTEFHLQIDGGQDTITFSPGAMPGTGFEERFALEFGLGALPGGATMISSVLTLHLPVVPAIAQTTEIHGYAGDGTIQAADLSVTNFLTTFDADALSVDIPIDAAFLQSLLAADEGFAGFALRNITDPSGVFTVWTVDGPAATDPTLAIEYAMVPEPGTLLLTGSALAACALRASRRRGRGAAPGTGN